MDNQNFLDCSEIKDQTVIMIVLSEHPSEPFYVVEKKPGRRIEGTTIFWGERLKNLIHNSKLFSEKQHHGMNRLFAIGEPNRKNLDVVGYRAMTQTEKDEWIKKVSLIPELENLIVIIKNS